MKKQNYITIEEFTKLPLSDAIMQVVYDIEHNVIPSNIEIDMDKWGTFKKIDREKKVELKLCSVCLGGAALLSFDSIRERIKSDIIFRGDFDLSAFEDPLDGLIRMPYSEMTLIEQNIAETFNSIRRGDWSSALSTWYKLVVGKTPKGYAKAEWINFYHIHRELPKFEFHGKLNNQSKTDLIHLLTKAAIILKQHKL